MAFFLGCSDSGDPADVSNTPPEGTISLTAQNTSADSTDLTLSVTAWDEESDAVHILCLCASFDTDANHHTDYPFVPGDSYLDAQNQLTATRTGHRPAATDTFYVVRCSLTASDDLQSPGGHFQSTTLLDSVFVSQRGS